MYLVKGNVMIRSMKNHELKEVMDIWLKTTISAHNFIPEQYWIKNYEVVEKEYMPIAETFVFAEESMIKGFISIIDKSFIGALFVLEEFQGQGIGKKLINYCKLLYPKLELTVFKANNNSVEFYKGCNFELVKEQVNEDSGYLEYLMKFE